jgi:hypothetical protein
MDKVQLVDVKEFKIKPKVAYDSMGRPTTNILFDVKFYSYMEDLRTRKRTVYTTVRDFGTVDFQQLINLSNNIIDKDMRQLLKEFIQKVMNNTIKLVDILSNNQTISLKYY